MPYDPRRHRRRSIRLAAYDCNRAGAYFVTVCTRDRSHLFGDIYEGMMRENAQGRAVRAMWEALPERYPRVRLGAFVVMPNHAHGVVLVQPDSVDGVPLSVPPKRERRRMLPPRVVGSWKMTASKQINVLRGTPGTPVWQRGYYEHVIRSAADHDRIRRYIDANPARWDRDRLRAA